LRSAEAGTAKRRTGAGVLSVRAAVVDEVPPLLLAQAEEVIRREFATQLGSPQKRR
jgi:hypothetical protein